MQEGKMKIIIIGESNNNGDQNIIKAKGISFRFSEQPKGLQRLLKKFLEKIQNENPVNLIDIDKERPENSIFMGQKQNFISKNLPPKSQKEFFRLVELLKWHFRETEHSTCGGENYCPLCGAKKFPVKEKCRLSCKSHKLKKEIFG
jgi:hypothetical protein